MTRTTFRTAVFVIAGVLLLETAALAGPPLICHPFNIGDSRSLPFQGPDWSRVDPSYDTKNLLNDTTALLSADTPVLVRMETLRRATLYSRHDARLAAELFDVIRAHAEKIPAGNTGRDALLARFDYAYLAETYRQAAQAAHFNEGFWAFKQADPGKFDGRAAIENLIAQGGGPEMEFAAAVIASSRRGADYFTHLRNASAQAKPGSLLAQNLESHFGPDMKSARLEVRK